MAIQDIAINSGTNDLDFIDNGLYLNEGRRAVAQRIRIKFGTFKGEWFLNLNHGIPYRQDILIKNPDTTKIASTLRKQILDTPEVTSLSSFTTNFNSNTRQYELSFEALTSEGEIAAVTASSDVTYTDFASYPSYFTLLFDLPNPIAG